MEKRWVTYSFLLLSGWASGADTARAPNAADAPRYTLDQFVDLATKQGFQLKEQEAKIEFAEARLDMARSKAYVSGTLDTLLAPIPGVTSSDPLTARTDWQRFGFFWTSKLEFVQPLYTFGALSAGREAARQGVDAEKRLLESEALKLRSEIHEFYYGYQLAFELGEIAHNVADKLSSAVDESTRSRKTSAEDLEKLRAFLLEARIRSVEADTKLNQIRAGMAWKIGVYGETLPRWDRANLVQRDSKIPNLEECQRIAKESRPELKALANDVAAKEALAKVEEGLRLPTLFLAGRLQYNAAPIRPDLQSPYAYDPYNDLSGGLGIGLRWNLGLFESNSKVAMARAEKIMAEARYAHLGRGILVEVEKNYLDVVQVKRELELRNEEAERVTRKYRDAFTAYGLGTGSARAVLEALGTYALSEKERLEAMFQYNLNLAKLEQVLGHTL